MKSTSVYRIMNTTMKTLAGGVGIMLVIGLTSCDTTFENPNAASEDQVVTTVEGLKALTIGLRREYSISVVSPSFRAAGLSTREFGVVVGFSNPQDIELGGTALTPDNGILAAIWSNTYQVMAMAQQIIDNAQIVGEDATRASYLATGYLFKGIALGNLAQFYESMPITVDPDGDGQFQSREAALQEAVRLLEAGIAALGSQTVPEAFHRDILGSSDFNLGQTLNAFVARFQLYLGNNGAAITSADAALAAGPVTSVFSYDDGNSNENPLYLQTTLQPATYWPVDNFGFDPDEFVVGPADGRLSFYLSPFDTVGIFSGIPVEVMRGFYDEVDEPIPVILPGELYLTKAEAYARQGDLNNAVSNLDLVLTKTDDPFGVNADLPAYSGPLTPDDVLLAIYRHRRIEMFLMGTSLEDHRRFFPSPGFSPPLEGDYNSFGRNRNYYPYPENERANNPNTPLNPAI